MTKATPTPRKIAPNPSMVAPYGQTDMKTVGPIGKATAAARRFSAALSGFVSAPKKTIKARVDVGKVVLPLHMDPHATHKATVKKNNRNRLLHHMAMQEMAGTNWQGQPRGFRIAPTSRKNLATHRPAMLTRVEGLAKAAGMTA